MVCSASSQPNTNTGGNVNEIRTNIRSTGHSHGSGLGWLQWYTNTNHLASSHTHGSQCTTVTYGKPIAHTGIG